MACKHAHTERKEFPCAYPVLPVLPVAHTCVSMTSLGRRVFLLVVSMLSRTIPRLYMHIIMSTLEPYKSNSIRLCSFIVKSKWSRENDVHAYLHIGFRQSVIKVH